jgi:hypothetical protein
MKLGNLTKAAMMFALMMGQVTPPNTNSGGYYEDDGDFHTISTGLRSGWGWGLNQAFASGEDISGYSAAQVCFQEESEPDYTGSVTAPQWEDPYFDPFDHGVG